ncbi:helix-turn-helix transcriptional regulator [Moraxella atlantae]|uniref:S24 family peptidase n=1 Tax=Faucicola atlantae TaxID=34059 RepID=UPI0037525D55
MLKSVSEIRLENVEKLMQETGLDRASFAERFDTTYNMFSQYFTTGKSRKVIGDKKARSIEEAYNKPKFWLDNEHDDGPMDKRSEITVFERDEPARDVIQRLTTNSNDKSALRSIPYLDAPAACGLSGKVNGDDPDVLGRYEISEEFLARLGLPTDGEGLILIEADGDSMMPSIPDKTPLLVNTKESDFSSLVTGKVYVFCADGEMLCKRIYRNLDSTITLKSDNHEMYDDVTVNKEKFNEFHLLGRVKFAFVEM